jgi:hypothetical protein
MAKLLSVLVLLMIVGCQTQGPQVRIHIADSPNCTITVPGLETLIEGKQDKTVTPNTNLQIPIP